MRLFISPDISAPGGEAYDESLCVGIPFIDNVKASNSIGQVKEMIENSGSSKAKKPTQTAPLAFLFLRCRVKQQHKRGAC
jgi:hypothetical protein